VALKDLKKSKQGTFGKRNHITLTIPQKVEIIRKLEKGENLSMVMALYNIALSTIMIQRYRRSSYDLLQQVKL
jgi:hypothetical protein